MRHRVFSLHANTHLHANDRQGLERLCHYGARGALALERLSRMEDGRLEYRMKRPLPDSTTYLFFTGLTLHRRLASLVPLCLGQTSQGSTASLLQARNCGHFCSLKRGRRRGWRRRARPRLRRRSRGRSARRDGIGRGCCAGRSRWMSWPAQGVKSTGGCWHT
ncbi:transposase [Archangium sp. miwbw1]|uniref:Transposase n=1 Tax=Archangium lansingense TaxID=2995310 RepID=A0ABT4AGC6_9BACT|nr:transposase [Archangium lansinium]